MDNVEEAVHPRYREVPVMGGARRVTVRPWTMAQRAELRPKIADLLGKVMSLEQDPKNMELPELVLMAEDEVVEIVRRSVKLPEDLRWDQLDWEDVFVMAQAVWDVCVAGLATKLGGALAGPLAAAVRAARKKTPPKQPATSSGDSLSSPADGERTPSG